MFWKLLLIIKVVLLLICMNFSRFIVGQGKIDVGKGTGGPPLAVLCTYYSQRVSIALQRVQVNTILRHAIFIGETSSRLTVQVFYPFKLCLLWLVGVLEHDFFLFPFVTPSGVCPFGSNLGPPSLSFLFTLCWILCLMEFTRVHHPLALTGCPSKPRRILDLDLWQTSQMVQDLVTYVPIITSHYPTARGFLKGNRHPLP